MAVNLTRLAKCFEAVGENLHFGRAAQQLGMSQPALSQAIKQLEGILGCQAAGALRCWREPVPRRRDRTHARPHIASRRAGVRLRQDVTPFPCRVSHTRS